MTEQPISAVQAARQTGLSRDDIVAAIQAGKIPSTSTKAPWMVLLSDVQAWQGQVITRAQFIARFTDDEKTAAVTNPQVLTWWLQLMDMPMIDLSSDLVKNDVAALVSAGVLTSDRATAILAVS